MALFFPRLIFLWIEFLCWLFLIGVQDWHSNDKGLLAGAQDFAMSIEIGITIRFSIRFSNNCCFTGSFKFATPIGKRGNLKVVSFASKLMPVEWNIVDISYSQNRLHQYDFSRVSEHKFLRVYLIRRAIHSDHFACAFLEHVAVHSCSDEYLIGAVKYNSHENLCSEALFYEECRSLPKNFTKRRLSHGYLSWTIFKTLVCEHLHMLGVDKITWKYC